jgi:hypothetical protein
MLLAMTGVATEPTSSVTVVYESVEIEDNDKQRRRWRGSSKQGQGQGQGLLTFALAFLYLSVMVILGEWAHGRTSVAPLNYRSVNTAPALGARVEPHLQASFSAHAAQVQEES